MTKEDIEELIQQTKPEFLNEKVIKESGLETACSQSYAKGWNACNKYWNTRTSNKYGPYGNYAQPDRHKYDTCYHSG